MISRQFFSKLEDATYLPKEVWKQALSGTPQQISLVLNRLKPKVIASITDEGILFFLTEILSHKNYKYLSQINELKKVCQRRLLELAREQARWITYQKPLVILFWVARTVLFTLSALTVMLFVLSDSSDSWEYLQPYLLEYMALTLIGVLGGSNFYHLQKRLAMPHHSFYFKDKILKLLVILGFIASCLTFLSFIMLIMGIEFKFHDGIYIALILIVLMSKVLMIARIEEFWDHPNSQWPLYRFLGAVLLILISAVLTTFRAIQYGDWNLLIISVLSLIITWNYWFQNSSSHSYPSVRLFTTMVGRTLWYLSDFYSSCMFRFATIMSLAVMFSPTLMSSITGSYLILTLLLLVLTIGVMSLRNRSISVFKSKLVMEVDNYNRVLEDLSYLVIRKKLVDLPPRVKRLSLMIILIYNIKGGLTTILSNKDLVEHWDDLKDILNELHCGHVRQRLDVARALYPSEFPDFNSSSAGKEFSDYKNRIAQLALSDSVHGFWVETSIELLQLLPMVTWKTYRYFQEDKTMLDSL